jgi:hypothetical protein
LYHGLPYATDLLSIQGAYESSEAVCKYNITLCTPLLCADYVDEEKEKAKTKATTPALQQAKTMGYDPTEVEHMSVQEVLDMTFGKNKKTCIQSGTGGW